MGFYSVTPPTNDQDDFNVESVTTGVTKIVVDNSWIGLIKDGSKVLFNWNPLDKEIRSANFPGITLGVRQLGEAPTLRFEAIESTIGNFRLLTDVRGNIVETQGGKSLGIGRRQAVATEHTVSVYGEGEFQRTRRWEFYRVYITVDGDINIADPEDFVTFPVLCRIAPQRTLPESTWYGQVADSIP